MKRVVLFTESSLQELDCPNEKSFFFLGSLYCATFSQSIIDVHEKIITGPFSMVSVGNPSQ